MKRIYCISGLGADHRMFGNLSVEGHELVPVPWVQFRRDDTIASYAQKMTLQIKETDPLILGLSFGGMLAAEIAKQRATARVIIVSSAKSPEQLGMPGGGLFRWLIQSQVVPPGLLKIPNRLAFSYFGAETLDERQMLSDIIRNSDGRFMKWALKAMLNWPGTPGPEKLFQIHGTADKIIAPDKILPDCWVQGGSHIMIYNRAGEVSKIISDCLVSWLNL